MGRIQTLLSILIALVTFYYFSLDREAQKSSTLSSVSLAKLQEKPNNNHKFNDIKKEKNLSSKKATPSPIQALTKRLSSLNERINKYNFPESLVHDFLSDTDKTKLITLLITKEKLETKLFNLRYLKIKGANK